MELGSKPMDPNEIVTLRNKKTGDVKKVKRSELPSLGLPVDYVSKIDAQIKLGQQGNVNITDVAKTDPQAALIMQQAGVMPIEKSKDTSTFDASVNLINELEQKYMQAKGGEYTGLGALIAGTKKNIAGGLNLDVNAKTYNKIRKGFTANLKSLTGDTGVLTQQDYERIANLLPSFTDDPKTAKELFNVLRSQVAAKFGGGKTETSYQQPETKGGALASVVPGVAELLKEKQQAIEEQGLGAVPKQSLETLIPGINLFEKGGPQAALEVATLYNLLNIGKSGAKALFKKPSTRIVEGVATREAAAQTASQGGRKAVGENIVSKVEKELGGKELTKVPQASRKKVQELLTGFKEEFKGEIDPVKMLNRLEASSSGGTFTSTGGISAKAASTFEAAINRVLKEEFKNIAPGVLKGQSQIALGKTLQKIFNPVSISRGVVGGATTAGVIGAGYGLLNLLGMGKNKQ